MRRPPQVYRDVARLHVRAIDQGFLPQLGADFLALMYECLDETPECLLLTAERDGGVVGFITGAPALGGVYRRMLRRPLRLGLSLAPSLVRPRRLLRILEVLRYSTGHAGATDLPPTELLSLAVDQAQRGTGCAEELFRRFERDLAARGVSAFKIVVGAPLTPAHRFYRRMGALPVRQIEVHRGEASTVYVRTLDAATGASIDAERAQHA